jgi:uncharacterized protein YggE
MDYLKSLLESLVPYTLKVLITGLIAFVVVLLIAIVVMPKLDPTNALHNLSVEGLAKRKVTPDGAKVTLGQNIRGTNPVEIQKKSTEIINKLVANLEKLQIAKSKIQTSNYNLQPEYNSAGDIDKYSVNISVTVDLEKVKAEDDLISNVIAAGQDAGVNEVRNLNFYIKDQEKIMKDLEEEAIKDAKSTAEKRAQASGLRLGKLITVSTGYPGPYYYNSLNSVAPEMAATSKGSAGDVAKDGSTSQLEVLPGEFELQQTVTLIYETW